MKAKLYLLIGSMTYSLSGWAQDDPLEQLAIVDGVAQIATAADLENFAQAVNAGSLNLNAVLTADIDEYAGTPVSNVGADNAYLGTFDGQYHTITIDMTSTGSGYGLFRALSGTVKNLHVAGTLTAKHTRVGVICGEIFGGTIENCWSSADIAALQGGDAAIAGICGRASGAGSTIKNCIYSGNVDGGDSGTYSCAGVVGWCPNAIDIVNCIVTGEFNVNHRSGYPLARFDSANNTNAKCVNCFYVDPNGANSQPGATQVTMEQVASGEVCYLLNGDQSVIQWTQKIGEENTPLPFPTSSVVSKNDDGTYGNTTGIKNVQDSSMRIQADEIYDLMGRKIDGRLPKGVYILNGKKVMMK